MYEPVFLTCNEATPDTEIFTIHAPSPYRKAIDIEGTSIFERVQSDQIITNDVYANAIHSHVHVNDNIQTCNDEIYTLKPSDCQSVHMIESKFDRPIQINLPPIEKYKSQQYKLLVHNSTIQFDSPIISPASHIVSPSQLKIVQSNEEFSIGTGHITISSCCNKNNDLRWYIKGTVVREYSV